MYLLDSCVLIEFLRGRLLYFRRIVEESDPRLYQVPTIVEAELLYGAEHSKNPGKSRKATERLLAPLEKVPFNSSCAAAYGWLRHDLAVRGKLIGYNDMLIAATALAHGATLVTRNLDEFTRVPGLRVESWDDVGW